MKTLHFADLHLDGGPDSDPARTLDAIAEMAQDYAFVHVNGDIFEGDSTPEQRLIFKRFLDGLALDEVEGSIIIRGNHDKPKDLRVFDGDGVDVSETPQWFNYHEWDYHVCTIPHFNAAGIAATAATIDGMGEAGTDAFDTMIDALINEAHGLSGIKVLTFHGVVSGARLDNNYIPRDNGIRLSAGRLETFPGLCIGGHYHKFQDVTGSGKILYSGAPCRHTFGETGEKGVISVDYTNSASPVVEFIPIAQRPVWVLKCQFKDGQVVWDDPLAAEAAKSGGDVKITCTVAKEDIPAMKAAEIKAQYGAAHSLKFDLDPVIPDTIRSEAIVDTTTVSEAVAVWLYSTGYEVEQVDRLLDVLEEVTL